ncbi:MAG: hypothetical protein DRN66_02490 [Candidatus Nanohalarchaeota archaeon]|nr:MAG: hypothetical protein DRN66_02490 [Candidatus Nanohaloarchaeota archaeon]
MDAEVLKISILSWLPSIIWIVATLVIYKIYSFYGKNIRNQIIQFTLHNLKFRHAKKTICELHKYTSILILLFGGLYVISISPFSDEIAIILTNVFKTLLILVLSKHAVIILRQFLTPLLLNLEEPDKSINKISKDYAEIIKKTIFVFVWLAAIFAIMQLWNIDITWLVTSTAVIGIIVGLAAQSTLSNVIGGFAICAEKAYEEGDLLKLDDDMIVTVKKIGLKSTWLETYAATTIIIPNSEMSNKRIENMSYPYSKNLVRVKVNVSYDSDVDKVKHILIDIAKNTKHVLKRPRPAVYLIELGDYALNFTLVCPIPSMKLRFKIMEKIHCAIIKRFREENINIPFPTQLSYVDIAKDNFRELKEAVCRKRK